MTIEEKRQAIKQYCDSKEYCTCDQKHPCPLFHSMPDYKGQKETENDDLDKAAHEILNGVENDPVNHPRHYTQGSIECIDAMESAFGKLMVSDFCMCNAFKYVWRADRKNGIEDVDKAIWYLNKCKELRKELSADGTTN